MQRLRPQDDLYVELQYTPGAVWEERWSARLKTTDTTNYRVSGTAYAVTEWGARRKGRRMMARERKKRQLADKARQYGKKVIR